MKHKTITLHVFNTRLRVKLHSTDGLTWFASSPRSAAHNAIAWRERKAQAYRAAGTAIALNVPDDETFEGVTPSQWASVS